MYMVVNAHLSYNIIIGQSAFNALEMALPTLYLTIKFPLEDGNVGVIKGNQE